MASIVKILDNCGRTADQYTIIYDDGDFFCCSTNPMHPQGIGWWGDFEIKADSDEVEIQWGDLPEKVRECVNNFIPW